MRPTYTVDHRVLVVGLSLNQDHHPGQWWVHHIIDWSLPAPEPETVNMSIKDERLIIQHVTPSQCDITQITSC